jgi:hypothetical protein
MKILWIHNYNIGLTDQKQHSIKYKKSTGRWNLHMILIDNVYLRYRRNKTHGNTTKQVEHQSRGFNNGAFTNDHPNTSKIISDKTLIACNFFYFGNV